MRRTRMLGIMMTAAAIAGCSTTGPFGRERLSLPVGPSFVGGKGMQVFPTSDALIADVKDALSDVGLHSIQQSQDPSGLVILEARTADDRRSRVTILTSGANSTVSVKIGWLGDESLTRVVLDRIATRHGTLPPQPVAAEAPTEPKPRQPIFSRDAIPDEVMIRNQSDPNFNPSPFPLSNSRTRSSFPNPSSDDLAGIRASGRPLHRANWRTRSRLRTRPPSSL